MKFKFVLSCLLVFISPSTGLASKDRLHTFFNEVTSLQARFEQQVIDEEGTTLERTSGNFYLQRPGKFRWDYVSDDPEVEQGLQIYSDGKLITFFNPDFDSATQRSMLDALEQVPTLAIVQSGESLDAFFNISEYGITDGLSWVGLKPKNEEFSYQGLLLGFDSTQLKSIVITDGFGRETRLTLLDVKTNPKLKSDVFSFTPPPGVDVSQQ